MKSPSRYNKATSYGAAKYLKNLCFDPTTGEIVTTKQKPYFDEDKLRAVTGLLFMIRFVAQNAKAAVDLLEQHDACQLVGQS
ncbi:MAG: hypothetical protein DDT39_01394 [Firmicutes bacterium]|nr:hypothetical protein [candidate division NPL-UPA2 bacterium]